MIRSQICLFIFFVFISCNGVFAAPRGGWESVYGPGLEGVPKSTQNDYRLATGASWDSLTVDERVKYLDDLDRAHKQAVLKEKARKKEARMKQRQKELAAKKKAREKAMRQKTKNSKEKAAAVKRRTIQKQNNARAKQMQNMRKQRQNKIATLKKKSARRNKRH